MTMLEACIIESTDNFIAASLMHFDAVLIAGSNAGVGNNYPLQAQ